MISRPYNLNAAKPFHKPVLTGILVWIAVTLVYPQASTSVNISNTLHVSSSDSQLETIRKAAHVVPTKNQYEALQNEFIAFIHFGPNTFTRMEWGNGMEDPMIFDLQNLDTDQWCRAMKDAEMKMVIITVKHHDGFVLWQSRYTKHGIMSSPFQQGQGDILKSLSLSCRKYGLKLGVYLSPADLYQIENSEGLYGNLSPYTERIIPRPAEGRPFKNKTTFTFTVDDYNEYFLNQLFELLTEYGPIHEVWFDGAHPKRKGGQKYNYLAWKELINTLAPKAVIFGKQDIRWCGNESGGTRDTEWNIVPYQEDPNQMNRFSDLTAIDLGSREKLKEAKFLHYQQAETNTSIREGWFYRDDKKQRVRSADDVFDIYERSVGGNSTFLLNIPPNRQGKFSHADVKVLEEVGQRIRETYSDDLLAGAQGPAEVIDGDKGTFTLLADTTGALIVATTEPITINRFVIQEAIRTHSERIEKHALDAWINNTWKEIAQATNVGYKRILRFPEVTSAKFRVRILQSRLSPAISNLSAHHYKTRPPQLSIQRDREGVVTITSKKHVFAWKPHGEDPAANLNAGYQIRYTTDGTKPNHSSMKYKEGFLMNMGEVRAAAQVDHTMGSEASATYGPMKANWAIIGYSSEEEVHPALHAFDADEQTYWQSDENSLGDPFLSIDLGADYKLTGFTYTPQQEHAKGMIEQGMISVSTDGKDWQPFEQFTFGNLINDPTTRMHTFPAPRNTRYIRIESKGIAGQGTTAAVAEVDFLVE